MLRSRSTRAMAWVLGRPAAVALACAVFAAGCSTEKTLLAEGTAGAAEQTCPEGQTLCDTACVDLATSFAHCGSCATSCGPGQRCTDGQCSCGGGLSGCPSGCADLAEDEHNCGSCGSDCSVGQLCESGTCICQDGLTACPDLCVDVASDGANCGACGVVCIEGRVCSREQCAEECAAGLRQCGTSCVDVATSAHHCGECDAPCPAGESCSGGVCGCLSGQTACSGGCVDTLTSPLHCGACGVTCSGGQACDSGSCACGAGQELCDGQCTTVTSDPQHCGRCDHACASSQTCTNGSCACAGGGQLCNGSCVSTQTDASNCGACGAQCASSQKCSAGTCVDGTDSSGGASSGGGASSMGGITSTCTNAPPPNDSTDCDTWATFPGTCDGDWFVSHDYCAESCGRCGQGPTGGATGAGGAATSTGGAGDAGAATTTGGTAGTGGASTGGSESVETVDPIQDGTDGWATSYWDCCKPHCAWSGNTSDPIASCDQQNQTMGNRDERSACSGGNAFMCWDYVPWSVSSTLSYGFAALADADCGRCYHLQFTGSSHNGDSSGASTLSGKHMIVQIINTGGLQDNQFDLLIPGGGVGDFDACSTQWSTSDLGAQYGGFLLGCGGDTSCVRRMCEDVFSGKSQLMAGCDWFLDWFGAADNPNLEFEQVSCPSAITSVSGMSG